MCASYGLDPRFDEGDYDEFYLPGLEDARKWAEENAGATVRPTGSNLRNLNPLLRADGFEQAWWGFGPAGVPAKYPTINARSEKLLESRTWKKPFQTRRGLAPATEWFEYQKPNKTRFSLGTGKLLLLATVTAEATLPEGQVSCYSLVMRPAAPHLTAVHDRMPLLVSPSLIGDWLDPDLVGDEELLAAVLAASDELAEAVSATPAPLTKKAPKAASSDDTGMLF